MKFNREIFNKIKLSIYKYIVTNKQFLWFVFLSLIITVIVRDYTNQNIWDVKPLLLDFASIVLIGSLGYFFKPKNQFKYFFTWLIIFSFVALVNSIYYVFYQTYVSFSLLSTLGQVETVGDSIIEKCEWQQFVYIIFPIIYYLIHRKLTSWNYISFVTKTEPNKKMMLGTFLVSLFMLAINASMMTKTDFSRLSKQWNRDYNVSRFGMIVYQVNDLVQSITPKFSSLFGYDEAAQNFIDFYKNNTSTLEKNKYTDKFEGYNVIIFHMESMQAFLMNQSFNGLEVTPNLNKLASEGLFFSNFYAQISTGTSSDTEFTLNTSLMPAQTGTVFVSYYNRNYPAIPKILKENGYFTFSTHANKASMWNREKMHPILGYEDMYFEDDFIIDEEIGLGLSDRSFYNQLLPMLEKIETEHTNYMGTIISLSNHSPFGDIDKYGNFDTTITRSVNNNDGTKEIIKDDFLEDTTMKNYLQSAHYADETLGEFLQMIKNSDNFDNTLFVFYGDHDAKIAKSEHNLLINYDRVNGKMLEEGDEGYVDYDYYAHELNKKVPLIFWTKNGDITGEVNYPMGMINVQPTLFNMLGVTNPYALGQDIFSIKNDNIVIFPNANFLTSKVYYNNSKQEYISLDNNSPIGAQYIEECTKYVDDRLNVSNDIIVYDLIEKEGDSLSSEVNK